MASKISISAGRVTSQVALSGAYNCQFICIPEEPLILQIRVCYMIKNSKQIPKEDSVGHQLVIQLTEFKHRHAVRAELMTFCFAIYI